MERKQIKSLVLPPELIARIEAERERMQEQVGCSFSFAKIVEALLNRALSQQAHAT